MDKNGDYALLYFTLFLELPRYYTALRSILLRESALFNTVIMHLRVPLSAIHDPLFFSVLIIVYSIVL